MDWTDNSDQTDLTQNLYGQALWMDWTDLMLVPALTGLPGGGSADIRALLNDVQSAVQVYQQMVETYQQVVVRFRQAVDNVRNLCPALSETLNLYQACPDHRNRQAVSKHFQALTDRNRPVVPVRPVPAGLTGLLCRCWTNQQNLDIRPDRKEPSK